jgi:hypothetical protein
MTHTGDIGRKLALLIPMLGSNHRHEQIATLEAIGRVLGSANKGWNDLLELLGGASTCVCSLQEPAVTYPRSPEPSVYPASAYPAPEGGWTEHENNPFDDDRMRAQ